MHYILRRIDDLGRICIPQEVRKIYHIYEGDPIEIIMEKDGIKLKRCGVKATIKRIKTHT